MIRKRGRFPFETTDIYRIASDITQYDISIYRVHYIYLYSIMYILCILPVGPLS